MAAPPPSSPPASGCVCLFAHKSRSAGTDLALLGALHAAGLTAQPERLSDAHVHAAAAAGVGAVRVPSLVTSGRPDAGAGNIGAAGAGASVAGADAATAARYARLVAAYPSVSIYALSLRREEP